MTSAAKALLAGEMDVAHRAVVAITLPYDRKSTSKNSELKVIRLDSTIGKWTDAGVRITSVGTNTITALVGGPGVFSVLALEGASNKKPILVPPAQGHSFRTKPKGTLSHRHAAYFCLVYALWWGTAPGWKRGNGNPYADSKALTKSTEFRRIIGL